MRIVVIYGNPMAGGFVHACLDRVSARLAAAGAEVTALRLNEMRVADCAGCFTCLRTGRCALHDDVGPAITQMVAADALVLGASVRNGQAPALFKRSYERITYLLGFTRALRGRPTLAIGAVGMASGRRALGRLLTLRDMQALQVGYLFFRTGIPTRLTPANVAGDLDLAADRLLSAAAAHPPLPIHCRVSARLDDFVIRRFMLHPNPDGVYDHIVARWKALGMM